MPENHVYQVWAKNLPKSKKKSSTPSGGDTARLDPATIRGCRRRPLFESQVVSVPAPVKRQRGNHDS